MTNTMLAKVISKKSLAKVISKNSPVLLVHCTIVSHNPLEPTSILNKMRLTSFRTVANCLDYLPAYKLAD